MNRPGGGRGIFTWRQDYMEYLVTRLNHNPLSIITFLDAIGKDRTLNICQTSGDHMDTHWLGPFPDGQKALYDSILRGCLPLDSDNQWVQESVLLVRKLFRLGLSQVSAFTLLAIAVPPNTYREEWHQMLCRDLENELPGTVGCWYNVYGSRNGIEVSHTTTLDSEVFDEFLSKYLLDTGWFKTSQITFADGSQERYYHIHPLLTNELRASLLGGENSWKWPSNLFRKHADYAAYLLKGIQETDEPTKASFRLRAEHLTILAACDTNLAWCYKEQPQTFPRSARQSALLMAYQFCVRVAKLTKELSISSFDLEPTLDRANILREVLSDNDFNLMSLSWPHISRTAVDFLMELTLLWCDYRAKYDVIEAGVQASTCLIDIASVRQTQLWDPRIWPMSRLLLSELLLFRAQGCYFARNRSAEARQSFEMAIRNGSYEASTSGALTAPSSGQVSFHSIWSKALKLLAGEDALDSTHAEQINEQRLAAFFGLEQVTRDLTYFYGFPIDDPTLYATAISDAARLMPHAESRPFPLRKWFHNTADDDIFPIMINGIQENDTEINVSGYDDDWNLRNTLMTKIDTAIRNQDRVDEMRQRQKLVSIAISDRNWEAAAGHILRIMDLERHRSGLPNPRARDAIRNKMFSGSLGPGWGPKEGNLHHQLHCAAQYGSVFLRLGSEEQTLFFFEQASVLRVGNIYAPAQFSTSWQQWVDRLLNDIRTGILILASSSEPKFLPKNFLTRISSEEAEQLDLSMQAMIIRCAQERHDENSSHRFKETDVAELQAMVKCPFDWNDPRIGVFFELGMVHRMLHFESLVHNDPGAFERRRVKGWLSAYPKQELDLSALENRVKFSPRDPKGLFTGSLKHKMKSFGPLKSTGEVLNSLDWGDASREQRNMVQSLFQQTRNKANRKRLHRVASKGTHLVISPWTGLAKSRR